jgi:acetyl-CoA synthetase
MERLNSYEELYASFRWEIPERYNMAADVCDRHATDPAKVALIVEEPGGAVREISFREVQRSANQMANLLVSLGLTKGDRVLLLLTQNPWTAIGHVACWKAGLVSVPASVLFAADAVAYRLNHAGIRVIVTDRENLPKALEAKAKAAVTEHVFVIDGPTPEAPHLADAIASMSEEFTTVETAAEDPAFLNFTSGTTGQPKGVLQPHRTMLGHLPGVEFGFGFFPQPGDRMWSPADWAWLGALMDVLIVAWYHGVPVLTFRAARFDPEQAFAMMGKHKITTSLLMPTMLRMMREVPDPVARFGLTLRVIGSGGEAVGKELHDWAAATLGVPVNELFGQTECNVVLANNAEIMPVKPGSMGRAVPGHIAAIVDDAGNLLPPNTVGNLAFKRPDPVMMLEYWNDPKATAKKYVGDWLITGDLATCDEDGYYWFQGRADDVITSSGYRIGPGEIEEALTRHPAVLLAAAVGVPDPIRTESIKAFVVPRQGIVPSPALVEEIREFVRDHLAKHEVPREIEFVASLPMTTTGKIMRRALRDAERAKRANP